MSSQVLSRSRKEFKLPKFEPPNSPIVIGFFLGIFASTLTNNYNIAIEPSILIAGASLGIFLAILSSSVLQIFKKESINRIVEHVIYYSLGFLIGLLFFKFQFLFQGVLLMANIVFQLVASSIISYFCFKKLIK